MFRSHLAPSWGLGHSGGLDRLHGKPAQAVDAHIRQEQFDFGWAHLQILRELQERREARLAAERKAIGAALS